MKSRRISSRVTIAINWTGLHGSYLSLDCKCVSHMSVSFCRPCSCKFSGPKVPVVNKTFWKEDEKALRQLTDRIVVVSGATEGGEGLIKYVLVSIWVCCILRLQPNLWLWECGVSPASLRPCLGLFHGFNRLIDCVESELPFNTVRNRTGKTNQQ